MWFPPGNSERRHRSLRVRGTKWLKTDDFGNLGGLLTGFNSVGEHLIKQLETAMKNP